MSELPDRIMLRVGEERTLQLPSLAQGGYRWEVTADDKTVVDVAVRFEPAATASAGTFSPFEVATVRGRHIGSTVVHCRQRRSWESPGESLIEQTVTVEVTAEAQSTKEGVTK